MAIETAADRAVFVDAGEFGVVASYAPAPGGEVEIEGVFDAAAGGVFSDPGVVSAPPQFVCRSADLPTGAAPGDAISINGEDYIVRVIVADGTGMARIDLEEAE